MVSFFVNHMFFWISQLFSTNQKLEMTETDELIQDIKFTNQKMMNLIRMKSVVTNLMMGITINQILPQISKRKQKQIESQSTHKIPHMQIKH